jgi:hypothetical protein
MCGKADSSARTVSTMAMDWTKKAAIKQIKSDSHLGWFFEGTGTDFKMAVFVCREKAGT